MSKKNLNTMPNTLEDGLPIIKRHAYMDALRRGDYHKIAQGIIQVLNHFDNTPYTSFGVDDLARIDDFVITVLMVMTDAKFLPPRADRCILLAFGHVFANLTATSSYGTTNPALVQALRSKGDNFERALFLCNSACSVPVNQKVFFDIDPYLASIWFNSYVQGNSNHTAQMQSNLMQHYANMDDRWQPSNADMSVVYFTVSYFAQEYVRRAKGIMNKAIRERFDAKVTNNPDPKSIAIVSAKWHRNHAVYKSSSTLVNQLMGDYKLTLVHLGEKAPHDIMTEGFDTTCMAYFKGDKLVLPPSVIDNDFQMIYYPDIGMNAESIWMSNSRLAPIQAMGYGHPDTSGDGSCIDYFIGGTCEKDCFEYYSEQMVLLPGIAQAPAWPSYERKHNWVDNTPVKVACIWGPDKYNYCMLQGLVEISKKTTQPFEWHFYPSPAINRYAAYVPFVKDIKSMLPNSTVHGGLHYADYMEAVEKCDFTINSFPFGGYNTIVESMYLGLPVVSLEGPRFYSQAASYVIRQVGMSDLTTTSPIDFVELCAKMINDNEYRATCRKHLADIDLKGLLFENIGNDFKKAVDYIIANHPIERGEPIIIGETNA